LASTKEQVRSALLVLRFRRGDDRAMEELISLWERPLFYYVRRLVNSEEDTWDALQEVWCQVIRKIGKLRDPGAVATWLYKIAHNSAVGHLRRQTACERLPEDDAPEMADGDTELALPEVDAVEIHRALDRLSLPHREILTLRFLEGFSLVEISEITEVSVGTVKSRLHYAKRAMRDLLEGRLS